MKPNTTSNPGPILCIFTFLRGVAAATVLLVAISCLAAGRAEAQVINLGTFGGHDYLYDTGSILSFNDAQQAAQALGGQLVSITSEAENNFLISMIGPIAGSNLRTAWIGLSRPSPAQEFVWVSGEAFVYSNWRPEGVGLPYSEPTGETAGVFYVNDFNAPLGPIPVGYWADTFSEGAEPFNAIYEVYPLQLTAAASRKTHGGLGDFDINLPLTGEPGVECRSSGGIHALVFSFTTNVVSGSASVTGGSASVAGSPTFSGNNMTVNLTNVTNAQTVTVTLSGVTNSASQILPDTALSVGFLLGDTNGDRFVNAGDSLQTRNRSGQATDAFNFRSDVNADGFVNSGDTIIVRARSGSALP